MLRKFSFSKDLKLLLYSLLLSLFISCLLYVFVNEFSESIINFIYKRGKFNVNDVKSTAKFLQLLTPAYIILIFTSVIFQPFFSLGVDKISRICLKFSMFLIFVLFLLLLYIFLNDISSFYACFIFINTMSLASLVVSILSLIYFLSHEN